MPPAEEPVLMRRRLLVAAAAVSGAVLLVVIIVLGYDEVSGEKQVGQTNCVSNSRNLLAAQSVTTAQFVPCFGSEIAGWQLGDSTVEPGGTTYGLASSEVPGAAWTVLLRAGCQPAADAEPPTPTPLTGRPAGSTNGTGEGLRSTADPGGTVDESIAADADGDPAVVRRLPPGVSMVQTADEDDAGGFIRTQWFQFAGGCVTSTVAIPARFDRATILGETDRMLVMVPRSALNDQVLADTGGSLALDP